MNLIVAHVGIRRDADGRFSLNDLHRAAGGEKKNGPSYWLSNQQTRSLIAELATTGIPVVALEGAAGGTFVVKELVYAYAMWISPAFHLKVIRAYDDMLTTPHGGELSRMDILQLAMDSEKKRLEAEARLEEIQPTVVAFRRIAGADGSLCLREAAKALQMPERKLAQWMHEKEWLFRGPKGGWMGYADKTKAGFLTHKVHTYFDEKVQEDKVSHQVRITPSGLAKLAKMLGVELAEEHDAG